jgi:hypothetical protein
MQEREGRGGKVEARKTKIIEAYRQQSTVAKKARLFDVIGTEKRVNGELATVA